MPESEHSNERRLWWLLKITFGVLFVVAGLDKFLNLLTDWTDYLSDPARAVFGEGARGFMYAVGVFEVAIGLGILSRWTRMAAFIGASWLVAIAANLLFAGYLDVAVRDLVMAIAGYVLARLTVPEEREVRNRQRDEDREEGGRHWTPPRRPRPA